MILSFYIILKKIGFVVIFNFLSIGLSRSHDLGHRFSRSFLYRGVFLFVSCLIFEEFFYTNKLYFIKNISFEKIFLICPALHNIFFLLFYSLSFIYISIYVILYWFE
jgi:hypothetical protein